MNSYPVSLDRLKLNTEHFRIMPQPDEEGVLLALASDRAGGLSRLSESFMTLGYLPTEPLVTLACPDGRFLVLDGNRRVAVLKYAHGMLAGAGAGLPARRMGHARREATWRLPCLVFVPERRCEAFALANKIHREGACPARRPWCAMTLARFERASGNSSPTLDIAERFLLSHPEIVADDFDFGLWEAAMARVAKVLRTDVGTLLSGEPSAPGPEVDALLRRVACDPGFDARAVKENAIAWMLECGFLSPAPPLAMSKMR